MERLNLDSRSPSLANSINTQQSCDVMDDLHGWRNCQHLGREPCGGIARHLSAVLDLVRGSGSSLDATTLPLIEKPEHDPDSLSSLGESNNTIRYLDLRLLPPLFLMAILHGFNKNVSHANTMGMSSSLNIDDDQWSILLMLYFVGFILSTLAVVVYSKLINIYVLRQLCGITLCSGLVTGLITLAPKLSSIGIKPWIALAFSRFVQGVLEGAYSLRIVTYLLQFYTSAQLCNRMWLFFLVPALSPVTGALYAYAVIHIVDGPLSSWQWLYLGESLTTIVLSIISSLVLPARAMTTPRKPETNIEIASVLYVRKDTTESTEKSIFIRDLLSLIKRPPAYTWMLVDVALGIPATTISMYLPQLILRLRFSPAQANLLTVFPYLSASFILLLLVRSTDKPRTRHMITIIFFFQAIGFSIYRLTFLHPNPGLQTLAYISTFLMALGIGTTNALAAKHYGSAIQDDEERLMLNTLGVVLINITGIITSWTFRVHHFHSDDMTIAVVCCGFIVSIIGKTKIVERCLANSGQTVEACAENQNGEARKGGHLLDEVVS